MASQPPEALARVQEDEREVLKAIYMEDYEETEAKGAWSVRTSLSCMLLPCLDFVDDVAFKTYHCKLDWRH
jgi:hypothetical protein